MSAPNWKDITPHYRGDDNKPHWWETRIASLRLAVGDTQLHWKDGEHWWLNCQPWYSVEMLKANDEQSAKTEALALVRAKCEEIIAALEVL